MLSKARGSMWLAFGGGGWVGGLGWKDEGMGVWDGEQGRYRGGKTWVGG